MPEPNKSMPAHEGLQVVPQYPGLEVSGDGLEMSEKSSPSNPKFGGTVVDEGNAGTPQRRSRLFGLRPTTFWLILVVVGLIIAIAAIGGGVGGALRSRRSQSSLPTVSATPLSMSSSMASSSTAETSISVSSTSSAPASPATSSPSCVDGFHYTASTSAVFEEYCNSSFMVGTTYNTTAGILTRDFLNSFQDCMDACGLYNQEEDTSDTSIGTCGSVTYRSGLSPPVGQTVGECWLMNATASGSAASSVYVASSVDFQSGSLITG